LTRLERAAAQRYATNLEVVATAGAQAAIQLVPLLRAPGQAAVLTPTYNEHAAALRAAGWQVTDCRDIAGLGGSDLAVVVNPNNPDGQRHAPQALRQLADRVGVLVVDESFVDPDPGLSVASLAGPVPANLIVLRSFGKFYGLAGLRLGFALCAPGMATQLRDRIGPWPVSGLAVTVAVRALQDTGWAQRTTTRLRADATRLDALAQAAGWQVVGGTPLFRTYHTPDAGEAQATLAGQRIWSRIFPYSRHWIRLGLPADASGWSRLASALTAARA
ncbi:aminotransferase class I/II-fold pyridoxal phosphate-dependent enzyme, partial [Puniceibacterium confluentis]|uniref:aminotransferase class I/II-fold pyridoxal phosphate-dependent enzyme n=1 Tax=Puniceibacterium confluentis TaxID=1958944 RepID=UPI0035627014